MIKFICPLIVVKDTKKAKDFYEGLLGQKVKYDFGENIQFHGDFSIHLEEHYQGLIDEGVEHKINYRTNNFELYFETEDILKVESRLKNVEVEFIHEIREQPWGQRVMRVYDYDYHIVEIGETLESLVLRLYKEGKSVDEIVKRTSMPLEFVNSVTGGRNE